MPTRCEVALAIQIGTVLVATDGRRWVFYGWGFTKSGRVACFKEDAEGCYLGSSSEMHIAHVDTLLRRLPAAARYLRREFAVETIGMMQELAQQSRLAEVLRVCAQQQGVDVVLPIEAPLYIKLLASDAELELAAYTDRWGAPTPEEIPRVLRLFLGAAQTVVVWALDPSPENLDAARRMLVARGTILEDPLPDGAAPPASEA